VHRDEDARSITLEVSVPGCAPGRAIAAVATTEMKTWEGRIAVHASGGVASGSAAVGTPPEWIQNPGHLLLLAWLDDGDR
jgi:hypothetical protein